VIKKRNNDFDLSADEVVNEFMKGYKSGSDHHSHHHHHHHHHHEHHHNDEKTIKTNDNKITDEEIIPSESEKKLTNEKKKKRKIPLIFRILIIIVAILFFIAILATGAVLILNKKGMDEIRKSKENVVIQTIDGAIAYDDSGKTIEYKGQKYIYNENIITFAFMGIDDKSVSVNISDEYGEAGQADTILLFAYDMSTGEVSMITVPRDTIVDVDIYSAGGNFARTEKMQICLSFAYGDGGVASCENVINSLERMLMGVPIDSYFSLRVRGVDALNAAVGGVELTSIETIGNFTKGERVHLQGTDARMYITRRDRSKIDSDSLRRERQLQYIRAFADKTIDIAKTDFSVITTLYETAKQYSVTDIELSDAVFYANKLLNSSFEIKNVYSLPGEYVSTDSFPEYRLDKEALYQVILDVFYTKA